MTSNIRLLTFDDLKDIEWLASNTMKELAQNTDTILLCYRGNQLYRHSQREYWSKVIKEELMTVAPNEPYDSNQSFNSRLRIAYPAFNPEWIKLKARDCRLIALNHMLVAVRKELAYRLHLRKLKGLYYEPI